MIDPHTLVTLILMAVTTYLTRIMGYTVLRNRTLSPRMHRTLESVPGCVLISVIAPVFVSDNPINLIALAITILAALRFSILPTVIIGVASTGLLRQIF